MSFALRGNSAMLVARNEFVRYIGNPFIIIVSGILLVFAVLNGVADSGMLRSLSAYSGGDDVLISVGLSQVLASSTFLCTIVAVFLGAMSMAEDRSSRTLGPLLTKPLYRRDIIIGKFLGLNVLLLLIVAVNQIVCSALLIAFFRAPLSMEDFLLRLSTYVLLLFFECMLSMAAMMLVGIVFKEILKVALLSITFLYIDWYSLFLVKLGSLSILSPRILLFSILDNLLNTSVPYATWLDNSLNNILILIAGIIIVFLVDCMVFVRSDES